jgi:hypothetical protein
MASWIMDGVMDYGWRKVRKGGVIYAYKSKWQSDLLLSFVGEYVVANNDCYYMTSIEVFKTYPTANVQKDLICKIKQGVN